MVSLTIRSRRTNKILVATLDALADCLSSGITSVRSNGSGVFVGTSEETGGDGDSELTEGGTLCSVLGPMVPVGCESHSLI